MYDDRIVESVNGRVEIVESRGVAWSREIQNCNLLYSSIETQRQLIFQKIFLHGSNMLQMHCTLMVQYLVPLLGLWNILM